MEGEIHMTTIKYVFKWFHVGLEGGEYLFLAFLIIGGILGFGLFLQQIKKNKLTRSQFIHGLLEKFLNDNVIQSFVYRIEQNEEWYTKKFKQDEYLKNEVYHALFFFNYICYLEESGTLPRKEYAIFEYNILKLATNSSFRNYMFQLYHSTEEKQTVFPFYYLLDSCAQKMPGGFLDKDSKNYTCI